MKEPIKVRKVQPKFPRYEAKNGVRGIFDFLIGFVVWLVFAFIFVFTLYTTWFCRSLGTLLSLVNPKPHMVPFWFGAVLVILVFPLTLVVILVNQLVKIIKH